jgi:hypothetical protein
MIPVFRIRRVTLRYGSTQCCGSVKFWYGSVPLTDGSGSCYFRHRPSRRQQKTIFSKVCLLFFFFFKVHLHHFSEIKSQKEVAKPYVGGFLTIFAR